MPNTHYDGNDDHQPVMKDTLEPGDTDKNGNHDTAYEEAQERKDFEEALKQKPF